MAMMGRDVSSIVCRLSARKDTIFAGAQVQMKFKDENTGQRLAPRC
jgi:hypothetical protein